MQSRSNEQEQIQSFQTQQERLTISQQFKQQMLKAWQPVPTLTKTIVLFSIMTLIFLGIGIPMLVLSQNIIEHRFRYDSTCTINTNCTITLQIPNEMVGPVFVNYELNNYYQNHRLYARSLSTDQLQGQILSVSDVIDLIMKISEDCDPIVTNADLYTNLSIDGNTTLVSTDAANPCGLIAYTLFNDSYILKTSSGSTIAISDTGIAWPSDTKKYVAKDRSVMWTDTTSERFMNWMRIAATPNFRKLWGRIDAGLAADNYTVTIDNIYDISSFQGKKYFVVTTSNFFGSKNQFLSITYIAVGGICLVVTVIFTIKKLSKKKKEL